MGIVNQSSYYYGLEAERAGIHAPILAALAQVQRSPHLASGEMGLGISQPQKAIENFPLQVQYAANTIRALSDRLITQGWQGGDLWAAALGGYSDRFLAIVAAGYIPAVEETNVGELAPCDGVALQGAYGQVLETLGLGGDQTALDSQLLMFIEKIPEYYLGLSHQRRGLLEVVRIWRRLDTVGAAMESLARETQKSAQQLAAEDLDIALKQFIQRIAPQYKGFPHQREALLRLVQSWRQLPSRMAVLQSLAVSSRPDPDLHLFDAALLRGVQQIPLNYAGTGAQRNALTEGFRIWRQLNSRQGAIAALGIDPQRLTVASSDPEKLQAIATELDRELLTFIRRVPHTYRETHQQREALIRLMQLWRGLKTRDQTLAALTTDLKTLEQHPPTGELAILSLPQRPEQWTPENLQLNATILPQGQFTWAQATQGGTLMPPDQATVEAMIRIATLGQQVSDRLQRPLLITSWYRPPHINQAVGGLPDSRHLLGDAIDFVCEGLTGNQIYWCLDSWWPGGLARYRRFPYLCHIDARHYRARWLA
ncbi:MAG: peptidase M15A [Spirulina sp. DLM2.Bin59]|nr:MAG: peptidase M15A [Spirulina sp. DLM2.Bin59]